MTLSSASQSFLAGYRIALTNGSDRDVDTLIRDVLALGPHRAPFAFEGAGMGCRILDERHGGRSTEELFQQTDPVWSPFLELGIGCALARLGHPPSQKPMVLDGYGFQRGLLDGVSGHGSGSLPPRAERGRGRAVWFLTGGRGRACVGIAGRSAHPDELWRGIGTACSFAGDPLEQAARLRELAGPYAGSLEAGVAGGVSMWTALDIAIPARTRRVQEALASL